MEWVVLLPIGYHLWLLHKQTKRFLWEGLFALIAFVIMLMLKNPYVSGLVLLIYMFMDIRGEFVLYLVSIVVFYFTKDMTYYLLLWVFIELTFVLHDKAVYYSYEMQLQEYQNKVFDKQVQEVEHMFQSMRGWRHDYHNHLQNLKAKMKHGDVEGSTHYLDELEDELRDIRLLVETENVNMNAILNAKLSLAVSQGIEIHVKAKVGKQIYVSDTDICALLGNLIDNAVEACSKVEKNKYIRIYIGQYKGQLYISCTNATKDNVRKLDEEYISNKRGNHGHGLKRMNRIVEKYEGSIHRKNEPGVFITEILLPM